MLTHASIVDSARVAYDKHRALCSIVELSGLAIIAFLWPMKICRCLAVKFQIKCIMPSRVLDHPPGTVLRVVVAFDSC